MKKILSSVVAIILVISFTTLVYASNLSNLKEQYNNKQDEISNKQDELEKIKNEQKDVLADIEDLSNEIGNLEKEIDSLNSQIKELNTKIESTEKEIEEKQAKMEERRDILIARSVAIYETGNITMLDVLLGAEDISDFLSKYYMMSEIAEYDNNLLEQIKKEKEEIEKVKEQLEVDKSKIKENKEILEKKSDALEISKKQLSEKNAELESNKAALNKSIDKLIAESNKLESEIKSLQSNGTSYSGGQMAWPLPGYTTITSPYGMRLHPTLKVYKLHTGVDIAGSGCNGKSIVAANDGTVITSKMNTAYGNMIIIDHGGGISTLYAHASKRLVSVGDKVKRGQVIAKVGTTGYSTGPHLHFEVRINGSTTNPLPYIK